MCPAMLKNPKNGFNPKKKKKSIKRKNIINKLKRLTRRISLDPRVGPHLARPLHASTPYAIVRDRVVLNYSTQTSGTSSIFIIGPMVTGSASDGTISASYGLYGAGITLMSALTSIPSVNLTNAYYGRARLHRLGVSITNTGVSTGIIPDGFVYAGVLNSTYDKYGPENVNSAYPWFVGRQELEAHSCYDLMSKPLHFHTRVLDMISYDTFKYLSASTPASSDLLYDSMNPIIIAIPATVNISNLQIAIHAEWTVIFTHDPLLQTLHSQHPPASDPLWHDAISSSLAVMGRTVLEGALGASDQSLIREGMRGMRAIF